MITLFDDTGVECLPDGSLITWLRIPGDDTSRAVAFVHSTMEDTHPPTDPRCTKRRITWISPGGWQPMTVNAAEINYPAHVISLGDIDLGDATHNDPVNEIGEGVSPDPQLDSSQLTPPAGYCEIPQSVKISDARITPWVTDSFTGGTWAREKALECAARLFASTGYHGAQGVLTRAEEFEQWLNRPTEDEIAPTMGKMAQVLTRWREAGVTLESLYYVIRAQVWADMHSGEDQLADIDRLERLLSDMEWAAEHRGGMRQTFIRQIDVAPVRDYLAKLQGQDGATE